MGQLPTCSAVEYCMPQSFLAQRPSAPASTQTQPHLYLGLSSSLLMMFWSTMSRTQMRIGKKVMPTFVLRFRFCSVSDYGEVRCCCFTAAKHGNQSFYSYNAGDYYSQGREKAPHDKATYPSWATRSTIAHRLVPTIGDSLDFTNQHARS